MHKQITHTVFRNFSVMLMAQTVTWISSFVLLLFLPRMLGSQDYGRLYLALSVKMILGLLIDFGGNYLIPKETARSAENGSIILFTYIAIRTMLWGLAIGIVVLLSWLLNYTEQVQLLILVFAISLLWEGAANAISAFFQGIEKMEYSAIALIVERVFVGVFAVAALFMGSDSLGIVLVFIVGSLLNLFLLAWFVRRYAVVKFSFDAGMISLMKSGVPFFLFSLFSVIYYRVDAVMLSVMTSDEVTGWYGGAYRFLDIVMMVPLIYRIVIFPVLSRLWESGELLYKTVGTSLKMMAILAVPTSLLVHVYAYQIIDFFMGAGQYGPSVTVLKLFALTIPLIYVDLILGSTIMGAANRQTAWATVGFIAIFLNIGANLLLIPWSQALYLNGGIGAAIATFVTELFMLLCALVILPAGYFSFFRYQYLLKPALGGVGMLAFILLLNAASVHWILVSAGSLMVYLAALYLMKLFDDQELHLVREHLSTRSIRSLFRLNNP